MCPKPDPARVGRAVPWALAYSLAGEGGRGEMVRLMKMTGEMLTETRVRRMV
jgi:hypothetical protein